jgi:hypothetical protein
VIAMAKLQVKEKNWVWKFNEISPHVYIVLLLKIEVFCM